MDQHAGIPAIAIPPRGVHILWAAASILPCHIHVVAGGSDCGARLCSGQVGYPDLSPCAAIPAGAEDIRILRAGAVVRPDGEHAGVAGGDVRLGGSAAGLRLIDPPVIRPVVAGPLGRDDERRIGRHRRVLLPCHPRRAPRVDGSAGSRGAAGEISIDPRLDLPGLAAIVRTPRVYLRAFRTPIPFIFPGDDHLRSVRRDARAQLRCFRGGVGADFEAGSACYGAALAARRVDISARIAGSDGSALR